MADLFSQKAVFGLLIALFLAVNVGGIFTAGMMMSNGSVHDCPFMGVPALCAMSPLEHLSEWQMTFAAVSEQFAGTILLLLLAFAVFWQFVARFVIPKRTGVYLSRQRYEGRVFDPLQLAFARGIIHTKVF
jgi:hypothetical protein